MFKSPLVLWSLILYTYTGVERSWWQTTFAHILADETYVQLDGSWNNHKIIGLMAAFTGVGQMIGARSSLHYYSQLSREFCWYR